MRSTYFFVHVVGYNESTVSEPTASRTSGAGPGWIAGFKPLYRGLSRDILGFYLSLSLSLSIYKVVPPR